MKTVLLILSFIALNATAAPIKTYQVTGPVLEVTPTSVTIDKSGEKWTVQRDAATKINGDLKVGSKATVKYSMTATEVEAKAETKKSK